MKKYLILFSILFFISSCTTEYGNFHKQKEILEQKSTEHEDNLQSFSVESIEARKVEILTTPDIKVLERIITMIEQSKKQVYIEVYILTEKRIIQALKDAKKRGVDVRVVLEKNVFGATSINAKTFKTLESAGVLITYDNTKLYNFVHTKLLLIDSTYIISTGNLSYASFTNNREFYVIGENALDLQVLQNIFLADFEGRAITESTNNLVISPINSRKKIETLLTSAKKNIYLYVQNFGDESILNILGQKAASGISITICMADPVKVKSNTQAIALLKNKNIDVRISKKPSIHAKSALVDDTFNYIGSENFSTNSLDENREIGILTISTQPFIQMFKENFNKDCPISSKQ